MNGLFQSRSGLERSVPPGGLCINISCKSVYQYQLQVCVSISAAGLCITWMSVYQYQLQVCVSPAGLCFTWRSVYHLEVCVSTITWRSVYHLEVCVTPGGLCNTITWRSVYHLEVCVSISPGGLCVSAPPLFRMYGAIYMYTLDSQIRPFLCCIW